MRAIVLAGGRGSRLRPYTVVLPKPLIPIGDRPVLDIVVRQLRRAGFERLTVATGSVSLFQNVLVVSPAAVVTVVIRPLASYLTVSSVGEKPAMVTEAVRVVAV